MANETKRAFLGELAKRYGPLRKLDRSQSLYEIAGGVARIYIRYSRVHARSQTFYGLREDDLRTLEGHPSLICFLWDGQSEPLLVPFSEYEDVFHSTTAASDGQYKAQIYLHGNGTELYISKAGRFNVEGCFGWDEIDTLVDSTKLRAPVDLSHSQVQTLLGAIGAAKSYDVWVPPSDRSRLDWSIANRYDCRDSW